MRKSASCGASVSPGTMSAVTVLVAAAGSGRRVVAPAVVTPAVVAPVVDVVFAEVHRLTELFDLFVVEHEAAVVLRTRHAR